jgi:hypothetical protein
MKREGKIIDLLTKVINNYDIMIAELRNIKNEIRVVRSELVELNKLIKN